MPRFRKKPVEIEAWQLPYNPQAARPVAPSWWNIAVIEGTAYWSGGDPGYWTIETLEGPMRAQSGDWIILGVDGALYPCKPEIFEKTYESVPANPATSR